MIVFQVIFGEIPVDIKPCLKSVKKYYPQVEVFNFEKIDNPIIESDKYRIDYLSKHDDILYIDWDVLLTAKLNLTNHTSTNFLNGAPDYSIIYSPKKEFWEEVETERINRGISKETYAWPRKLLRNKSIREIKDNFEHLSYSRKMGNTCLK